MPNDVSQTCTHRSQHRPIPVSTFASRGTPVPPLKPYELSHDAIVALSSENKCYLWCMGLSFLRKLGFTSGQIDYFRSFSEYCPIKPVDYISVLNTYRRHLDSYENLVNTLRAQSEEGNIEQESEEGNIEQESEEDNIEQESEYVEENARDLNVKYQDTYFIKGDKVINAVEFTGGNSPSILYRLLDKDGISGRLQNDIWVSSEYDVSAPKLGFINTPTCALLVERSHKKSSPSKYRKTLRHDLITIQDISIKENKAISNLYWDYNTHPTEDIFKKAIYNILFPEKLTFQEALGKVLGYERLSAAFASSLAIRLDLTTNKIVLMKYQWVIGTYNTKRKAFDMLVNFYNNDMIKYGIPV